MGGMCLGSIAISRLVTRGAAPVARVCVPGAGHRPDRHPRTVAMPAVGAFYSDHAGGHDYLNIIARGVVAAILAAAHTVDGRNTASHCPLGGNVATRRVVARVYFTAAILPGRCLAACWRDFIFCASTTWRRRPMWRRRSTLPSRCWRGPGLGQNCRGPERKLGRRQRYACPTGSANPDDVGHLCGDCTVGPDSARRRSDLDAPVVPLAGRNGLYFFHNPGGVPLWTGDRQQRGLVRHRINFAPPRPRRVSVAVDCRRRVDFVQTSRIPSPDWPIDPALIGDVKNGAWGT